MKFGGGVREGRGMIFAVPNASEGMNALRLQRDKTGLPGGEDERGRRGAVGRWQGAARREPSEPFGHQSLKKSRIFVRGRNWWRNVSRQ